MKFTLFGAETEESLHKSMKQHLDNAEWEKAASQCLKIIDKFQPDNPSLRIKLAEIYLKAAFKKKSLEQYQYAGDQHVSMGDNLKAISVYRTMLNIDPRLPLIRVNLAKLFMKTGEEDDAWKQGLEAIKYLDSRGLSQQSVSILNIMAAFNFNDCDKVIKLGEMLLSRNQPQKAIDQFLNAAELYLQNMEAIKASQAYERVLKADPNNLEAKNGVELCKDLAKYQKPVEDEIVEKIGPVDEGAIIKGSAVIEEPVVKDEVVERAVSDEGAIIKGSAAEEPVAADEVLVEEETRLESPYPQPELWKDFSESKLDSIMQKLTIPKHSPASENLREHYEMGVVYREMNLLDAAVTEFNLASQDSGMRLACFQMLKVCYEQKGMTRLAGRYQEKISQLETALGEN